MEEEEAAGGNRGTPARLLAPGGVREGGEDDTVDGVEDRALLAVNSELALLSHVGTGEETEEKMAARGGRNGAARVSGARALYIGGEWGRRGRMVAKSSSVTPSA